MCLCKEGYTLIKEKCVQCHKQCKTCNNDIMNCTTCYDEQKRILNKNNNQCECQDSYVQIANNLTCLQCGSYCYRCESVIPQKCLQCIPQLNREVNSETGECECKEGYFEDQTTKVCQQCHKSCKKCKDSSICKDECENQQCITCEKNCDTCEIQNPSKCLSCKTKSNRQLDPQTGECYCEDGFFEDPISKECQNCPKGCKKCKDNITCLDKCENQSCIKCGVNCETCEKLNPLKCQSCKPQSNRQLNFQTGQCECKYGYFQIDNQQICQKCDTQCKTCKTQSNNCTSCSQQLKILTNENECKCKEGFYEDTSSKECQKCPQNCKNCSNGNNCIQCQEKFFRNQNGECQQAFPSDQPIETLKAVANTTESASQVAVGTTMAGSVLLSSIKPNSSIAAQFLLLQKLNFMLLINMALPEMLHGFFKAFGGQSPFESLGQFNLFNSYIVRDTKGNLLPNKFKSEEIGESIFYNSGGCITIIVIIWIVSLPLLYLYKKSKQIQEGLEIKSIFVKILQWFCEKGYPFVIVLVHQVFSLVFFFSISIQFSSIRSVNQEKFDLLTGKIIVSLVILIYLLFLVYKFYMIINKKNNYQFDEFLHSREFVEQNIYQQINSQIISENSLSRNYKLIQFIIENILFPASITFFDFNFIIQIGLCLSLQTILLTISIFFLPMKSKIDNGFLIIEQVCWVIILSGITFIGLRIQKLAETNSFGKSDISQLNIISWVIISSCIVILLLNPLQIVINILLNLQFFKNKIKEIFQSIKNKLRKPSIQIESKFTQQPSLYEFNFENSSRMWSKQTINQKAILELYPSYRQNPNQPSLLSLNSPTKQNALNTSFKNQSTLYSPLKSTILNSPTKSPDKIKLQYKNKNNGGINFNTSRDHLSL